MPLRGRVGRHANTGAQCQNWVDDQQAVIALLNSIPASDGGAEGKLAGQVVAGVSSNALYEAILRFQTKHFPAQRSGFVDPGGAMLQRLELLAARASAAAASTPTKASGQWGDLLTGSVAKGLRKGLEGDLTLSHEDVVNIIRSTLSNGIVSASELKDLLTVATRSRSILPRSRAILELFVNQVKATVAGKGPYQLPTWRHVFAADMVCDFLQRSGRTHFPRLDRDDVGVGMLMRIANPGLLRQGRASLCGPTSLLFSVASDQPVQYVRFAIDLYEKGKAKLGRLVIEPGADVRSYLPPSGSIDQVDWMTMASIRDSENFLLDYDSVEAGFSGITMPGELAHWFRLAGYSDVREETNVLATKGTGTLDDASRLFGLRYRVCLFISDRALYTAQQSEASIVPDHWVVLRSQISRSGGNIRLKVFTWGDGDYDIPQAGDLPVHDFLKNFYGYVAAKP